MPDRLMSGSFLNKTTSFIIKECFDDEQLEKV